MLVFVPEEQIAEVKKATRLFTDTTHRLVKYSRVYEHCLTVFYMAKRGGKSMSMPCGFVLLRGKSAKDYDEAFRRLRGMNIKNLPSIISHFKLFDRTPPGE